MGQNNGGLFYKIIVGHMSIFGATDTHVWVSKPEWAALFRLLAEAYMIYEIHLWYETFPSVYWPA